MLFLLAWFGTQVVIAVLGEGLINLHQHLIGARLALDLLLAVLVFGVGRGISSLVQTRRSEASKRISSFTRSSGPASKPRVAAG